MPPIHQRTLVTLEARADRIVQQLTHLSRSQLRGLFDHGCVTIDGQPCGRTFTRVAPGSLVEVRYDPHQRYHEKPKPRPDRAFRVVFEDEHLIVVDKTAGVLTVPTGQRDANSLVERLNQYASIGRRPRRLGVVHRLDRGTSGLLVFGKTAEVTALLKDQFRGRKPMRRYLALAAGHLEPSKGTFRSHLATAANLDRYSTRPSPRSELAVTHYEVIGYVAGVTALNLTLETGRRNQIRVHLAEAGHPVLGEDRYQPDLATHPRWRVKRLALHAATLGFLHPKTGRPLSFDSPPPPPFGWFLRSIHRGERPDTENTGT